MKIKYLSNLMALISAGILLQTLYFKFTGHPQSMEIFSTLGIEPWGRIAVGIIELIVSIMLLIPSIRFYGAVIGVFLMLGAIGSHILTIGIESNMDGGLLFTLAIIVLVTCVILTYIHRNEGLSLIKKYFNK